MLRFKEYIIEVFDRPAKTTYSKKVWKFSGTIEHIYTFELDHKTYIITIEESQRYGMDKKLYAISFSLGSTMISLGPTMRGYDLTGFGTDQYKVLSTVTDTVFKFFKNVDLNEGDKIVFSMWNITSSTEKLYTKFAKELARRYRLSLKRVDKEFMLEKK